MAFENDDNFDKESYVGVNERLLEFYKKHSEGRVETQVTVVGDGIIVKALLFRNATDTVAAATGHSFLTDIDGEKVGEYTETVAVGRALAFMGFKVEKGIATQQEMDRFQKTKGKRGSRQESKDEEKGNRAAAKAESEQEVKETKAAAQTETKAEASEAEETSAPKEETKLRSNRFRLPTRKSQDQATT